MKKTIFIKNAAILTISSLILRFAGIIFKVWLASKIGSEGIGLYQLVFSVYMFAATFASTGICTAVTRLIGEELVIGSKTGIKRILTRCIELSCVIAIVTIAVLFFGAEFISKKLLHEVRAVLSLKILGFSLPFMAICSCLKGYFIARRKAAPSSISQLLEQTVRIVVIMWLVTRFSHLELEYACAAILLGDTIAEAFSCLFVYLLYKLDFKKLEFTNKTAKKQHNLLSKISHIALPITSGKYLNSLLRMIENVLVPLCLTNSIAGGNGISLFGMIKGMTLPVLFFPSTLLNAMSTLLLPEISETALCGKMGVIRGVVARIIKITSLVSIIFSALFFVCGYRIGILIYNSSEVGSLLCALSPIVPFMYLDAIADGILKGLDLQKFTFFTSISDSSIRIILILIFLKPFGIKGFIGIMYFSNFLTCVLNINKLITATKIKLSFLKTYLIPVCCAFSICLFLRFLLNLISISNLLYIIIICFVCIIAYIALLFVFKIIDYDDLIFIKQK